MNLSIKGNEKLKKVLDRINKNVRLNTLWECSNTTTVRRMGYSDHGPVHVTIVANIALKLLRNLLDAKVVPNIVKDYSMKNEDAEIIVVLGSVLHDIGNSIHRHEHEMGSVILANPLIFELINGLYNEKEKTIIASEVLNTIICHDKEVETLTIESGVVKLADALDMKEGRARIPFNLGKQDIYAVSAMAIDDVIISSTKEKPIAIEIVMNNSAGIFQVDYLLKNKLKNSLIEKYVSVTAEVKNKSEKKILTKYEI
ncbi:MAG: HD domain-containing protein [archaeon]